MVEGLIEKVLIIRVKSKYIEVKEYKPPIDMLFTSFLERVVSLCFKAMMADNILRVEEGQRRVLAWLLAFDIWITDTSI